MDKTPNDKKTGRRSVNGKVHRHDSVDGGFIVRRARGHLTRKPRNVAANPTVSGWAELNELRLELANLYPQAVNVQEIMDDVRS